MWNRYIRVFSIILTKYPTYSDYAFKNYIPSSLEKNLGKNFSSSENQEWAWMKENAVTSKKASWTVS